ncbi:hypothetical protein AVEN_98306-2-1, partial [Araneus ventricosus]
WHVSFDGSIGVLAEKKKERRRNRNSSLLFGAYGNAEKAFQQNDKIVPGEECFVWEDSKMGENL